MPPWFIILSAISAALQQYFCVSGAACSTKSCRDVGSYILDSMDTTVQPCDNFYDFACGRWAESFPKPKFIRGDWNNQAELSLLAQIRLTDQLMSAPTSSDSEPVKLMKKYYKSCIDQRTSNKDTIEKILEILRETGGWPMAMGADQWDENGRTWQSLEKYYHNIQGHSAFYSMSLTAKQSGSTRLYALTIKNSGFWPEMTKDVKTHKKLVEKVVGAVISKIDVNIPSDQLEADIKDLIYFENKLNLAYMDTVVAKERAEIVTSADEFIQDFKTETESYQQSRIDWEEVFHRMFVITNLRPSEKSPILIKTRKYFKELARILQETPKRTIVNFIHWKFLADILPYTTEEMEDEFYKILYDVENVDAKNPRWIYCVNKIGRNYASYSLFIKEYYQENSRQKANSVYRGILDRWIERIDNSNWLSLQAKDRAKAKIKDLSAVLGYSDFYDNEQNVNTYFEGLAMSDSYFSNYVNYEYHMWKRQIEVWGQAVNNRERLDDPLSLHVHLNKLVNHFVMTPPVLQSPLLDGTLPNYVSYSTVGSLMGHEISHILDDYVFETLLTGDETQTYKDILKCFIDSFNLHFNRISTDNACRRNSMSRGEFTLNENIADWNGLHFSYHAYQKEKRSNPLFEELKLPGFEKYTDDQMFFISFAQSWCTADDWDDPREKHAPDHIRVNGVVSNIAEFAEAFKCGEYTPMNPPSRCNIWTKSRVE